jgi:hypothetical protein
MPEPAKIRSATEPPQDPLKWARRAASGAWICGLASIGLAWAQARWYVFQNNVVGLFESRAKPTCGTGGLTDSQASRTGNRSQYQRRGFAHG